MTKGPLRKCVGCNEMKDKKDLLRIVKSKTGEILVDDTGKANGRGAYICKSTSCLELTLKNRGLERSFKGRIPKEIEAELRKVISTYE